METHETLLFEVNGPLATVTLNRPEARNAMSNQMVGELARCFETLAGDAGAEVRAIVLRAAGSVFCAGGDVRDLRSLETPEESDATLERLDTLLRAVNEAPQVVVVRIQGAAMGGGLGLVCVSDVAIAGERVTFGLPETRLGVAPSLISPYILTRVGFTQARRLMLTGSRVSASEARDIGLVHEVVPDDQLDQRVEAVVSDILRCAPRALRECKRLLFGVANGSVTLSDRAALLRRLRSSEEAQAGMLAFLSKQPAPWERQP
ncbi:MAG TPA: enoyl-CoA hydratase-related protein [Ktedonobacterales bacterium]